MKKRIKERARNDKKENGTKGIEVEEEEVKN